MIQGKMKSRPLYKLNKFIEMVFIHENFLIELVIYKTCDTLIIYWHGVIIGIIIPYQAWHAFTNFTYFYKELLHQFPQGPHHFPKHSIESVMSVYFVAL